MAYEQTFVGCYLFNTKTGRYHPIIYRPAPLPGGDDLPRYKSLGHHTDGFDSLEEAKTYKGNDSVKWTEVVEVWDGECVPASSAYFDDNAKRVL